VARPDHLEPGSPYKLGATWDGLGVNFAVFSRHAEKIELCLFDRSGRRELSRLPLPECTDEVWHGYLPDAQPGLLYGFRAHGPYAPQEGHRFNPNKLLLDPYAKEIAGQVRWTDALFGYRLTSARGDLSFDRRDSAPAMPKAVVVDDSFSWAEDRRPQIPWSDTVIYEAHLKGLTQLLGDIRPPDRGTFRALAHPTVVTHLKRLGVTAIELLPIHAYLQDRSLLEKGLENYWGYNTLSFFAPEPRYVGAGSANDLRRAIRRLHAAGIEVILDVVYNHTCEGSELGPTLSWRGLDSASYYRMQADNPRYCVNDTGTGNTINLTHPRVLQMVMDSLRYWATSYGVDGFRFDLGVTLGRESYGFDPSSGFFDAIRQDPVLARTKMISEPWDIGPGGYQLGAHPPGFAEWNDRFRDGVRRFWRGDPDMRPDLAARLAGSSDVFDHRSRRPWASVNYLASHDGQPLHDVVSFERKHNEANGEDNRDGHSENYSRNWGAEGPTDDPAIIDARERAKRAMLTTVMMSLGTPMLLAGDEFGRTQQGNNNAYCQDNAISWIDWSLLAEERGAALADFVARLIAIRRKWAVLRAPRFLHGKIEFGDGLRDIDWFDERGQAISDDDWKNPEGRALIMRRAARRQGGEIEIAALLINGSDAPIAFTLPGAVDWNILSDSADPGVRERPLAEAVYCVQSRSAVIAAATLEQS
jgi:glycogen operon protein